MVYKWYILPIGGLYGTYHLLREPETTIECGQEVQFWLLRWLRGDCPMQSDAISFQLKLRGQSGVM